MEIHKGLIERSKKGDNRAQYRLYELYAKAMFNLCYRMIHDRMEAEDLLQEAFTDAFQHLGSFRYESNFSSWLKKIVINKCINHIKRKKADLQFFEDMTYFDDDDPKEEEYDHGLSVDNVKKAMEQLPNGSRMIFSLYLMEGYDHREISQILNISESNSKSQYMRAKRKVKEILTSMTYESR